MISVVAEGDRECGSARTAYLVRSESKVGRGRGVFHEAWTDSNTFLAEAPPDNRHTSNVLHWNSDDFTHAFSQPIPNTQLRLAQAASAKVYPGAIAEWEDIILRLNNTSPSQAA
ncbi:hypothetical protein F5050DRAFT_1806237 [Lentinula boryana]|uniref:Uncharacterized protein n=1 Tax=Lentinula boryana TaxID=40481 RepID=A0ABQ8QHZ5_9AGAR|nr:hypothetical protein F5050DRAFT_1806237 [Lentinula boryana]